MDKKIIGAVFPDVATTEKVITELKNIGYPAKDISVFAHDKDKANLLENQTNSGVITNDEGRGRNAGRGAGIGAVSGGFFGGLAGLAIGLGVLVVPGIGPIAAAGPLLGTLTGIGIGAGGGGFIGGLVGLGMPEEHAKQFEGFLRQGKVIVLVEVEEEHKDNVYRAFLIHGPENKGMYLTDSERRALGEFDTGAPTRDITINEDGTKGQMP